MILVHNNNNNNNNNDKNRNNNFSNSIYNEITIKNND